MDILLGAVVALWILVLILAVVVFALARQIGVLYERVAPAGALMINQQLKVGDAAPEIAVEALNGRKFTTGQVRGSAQLLFFLSPDCPICKTLLPVLKTMHKSEKAKIRKTCARDKKRMERDIRDLEKVFGEDQLRHAPIQRERVGT